MLKGISIFLLVTAVAFSAEVISAQLNVPLRLDESAKSTITWSLLCDENYNCGMKQSEKSKVSSRKEELLLEISRAGKDFYLVVDSNQNGLLTDDKTLRLRNSGSVRVRIRKQVAPGKSVALPFEIGHSVEEEKGVVIDAFSMTHHYVASGRLTDKGCSANISLFDLNNDGSFTTSDSNRGTNLGIDRNRDGNLSGKGEFSKTAELIEFCGQNYTVSSLNNEKMTLEPTRLRLAKVNESVPTFSMELLNGNAISSESLTGKRYVLDFWASWCVPCVKNLSAISALQENVGSISIFSINVDAPTQKAAAEKIVDEAGLRDVTVIRGLGDRDPLWQIFGGMNSNQLTIPLYVLVDERGIIRYAGKGGDSLVELKIEVEKLVSAK